MSYLRKKLEAIGPPVIHTVRLVGYALREPARLSHHVAPHPPADRHRGHRRAWRWPSPMSPPTRRSQSFLYQRVDQQLEQSRTSDVGSYESGSPSRRRPRASRPDPSSRRTRWASPSGVPTAATRVQCARRVAVEVRDAAPGPVVNGQSCPGVRRATSRYRPRLPATITGFSNAPTATRGDVLRSPRRPESGGPLFRVRASTLANGDAAHRGPTARATRRAPSTSCSWSSWP